MSLSVPASYSQCPRSVTIPAGQTSASGSIQVINDVLPETNEQILLSLTAPDGTRAGSQTTRGQLWFTPEGPLTQTIRVALNNDSDIEQLEDLQRERTQP